MRARPSCSNAIPRLTVVGQASSAEQALSLIFSLSPDVALVDVELPGMNGIALAREVAVQAGHTRVLILSAYDDSAYVIGALEAGVAGYLLKTSSARELADAVRTAAGGALVLDEAISRRLTRRWRFGPDSASPALTARETEVLRLIAQGLPNRQIASRLGSGCAPWRATYPACSASWGWPREPKRRCMR